MIVCIGDCGHHHAPQMRVAPVWRRAAGLRGVLPPARGTARYATLRGA
eukprot:CAMPEP_0206040088 /NCGR_PEP_ID=MMETSP1466-20131121/5174_1 /ASSEMBLY_ACC=CAM_ASM_001126 /TAXON_ID=44452 /ORGANISM="Pavlova gyrans, Strain CCMP608" /LENGTH=47 /DNA_ID= /DNA_START= /DNA_END= /DNA_ORIENTATION=